MKNSKNGFVIPLLITIIAILAIGSGVYVYKTKKVVVPTVNTTATSTSSTTTNIVGNDRDTHGCIGSAGYSWCGVKNICLRVWEEKCEATSTVATTSLPTSCVDKPEAKAVITSLSKYSVFAGETLEIKGCNFSGFEGDKNIWIENSQGVSGILYGERDSNSKVIKVTLKNPLCSQDNSYSGLPCKSYLTLTPGTYKIWTMPWGANTKSNIANFTIISTSTSCTPNWSCGWAPCTNGYQGMTAVDSNNCGLPATGVQIACPALARVCNN